MQHYLEQNAFCNMYLKSIAALALFCKLVRLRRNSKMISVEASQRTDIDFLYQCKFKRCQDTS